MLLFLPPRRVLQLIAALCLAALAVALVSQYVFDMPPCAWCVLQRLIYLGIAALALVGAAVSGPGRGQRLASGGLLAACGGLAVSGMAAAWYQHTVAAQLFSCALTFADRFMTGSGLEAALPWLFGIYATCMDAAVKVLGVEYAIWSLLLYGGIVWLSLCGLWRIGRGGNSPPQV